VRAGNNLGDDGAASLAPSIGQMTQLTSLDLGGTLRASAGQLRWERVLANAGCALMMLRAVGWGGCARGRRGWVGVLRAASRGAAGCAGNEINSAGARALAPTLGKMTQLTSLDLSGMLRASAGSCAGSGCLQAPANALMMVGARAVARGAGAGGGVCEGRAEGRRCRQ
jgi:hypothetical protein